MIDPRVLFAVAIGAGIGGVLRLLITQFVIGRFGMTAAFYATLFINVSGSFLIGVVLETAQLRSHFSPLWRSFLATGVLGGYTTFSTFSYEAFYLSSGATSLPGILYAIASVALGIFGAFLGILTARAFAR